MSRSSRRSRSHSRAGTSSTTLADLHARRVAVHMVVNGREQFVQGRGQFEVDQDLGRVLRVKVSDPGGDFDVVFSESNWNGQILPGQAVGCEYLLRLS